ncbi:MAG: 2-iminoacetate synthase ThiH [Campylobacter sp.]|nr:2-iminoacetate synthase ThiH [Campylobacter sp.]
MRNLEKISSDILDTTLNSKFDNDSFSRSDVIKALDKKILSNGNFTKRDFGALLSSAAGELLEEIAQVCKMRKRAKFGDNIQIFTPLYISNYCDNNCVYCGFSAKNSIKRARLNDSELRVELENIAKTGLEEILILTGESETNSDLAYITNACRIAKEYFKVLGVEIYPLNTDEYEILHKNGVDYVTVFQETYNPQKYSKLHTFGNKTDFAYRFNAQERAILGGMRGVGFGVLLGLDDFRKDAFLTGIHAYEIWRKYPSAEIAFSVPRLRPIINNSKINPRNVGERELLQVMMAYRLFFESANITISTRESRAFRDGAVGIVATKISASVSVGIGGHSTKKGDEQFFIDDTRDTKDMCESLRNMGLVPVMSEYIFV